MGVRFECPQGHKLHVKAHLAGQRGICPECGLRFIVPNFSGGRVAEAAGDSSRSGYVSVSMESTATFNAALAANETGNSGEDSAAWYVRPASGGQFGPVDTAGFRQWIGEGRVAADAWVWRTGWSDWRPGVEAVRSLGATKRRTPPPAPVAAKSAGSASSAGGNGATRRAPVTVARAAPAHTTPHRDSSPTPSAATATLPADAIPGEFDVPDFDSGAALDDLFRPTPSGENTALMPPVISARAVRDKRRKTNQLLTIALAVVAMVLLVVLVVVLRRDPVAESATERSPTVPTSLAAE
jgi:hypothetical protein